MKGPPGKKLAGGHHPPASKHENEKGDSTQSQNAPAGNYEDRRNAAACFKNKHKVEDWHADYLGLMVTEDLPAGTRVWVNVRKRLTRNGEVYVSVVLKRQEGQP